VQRKILSISELKETINTISPKQCDFYAEGCAVALENQQKVSGVKLLVQGDTTIDFELRWECPKNKSGWKEEKKIADFGATALSFLLSFELTEFQVVEEALIGTGIDYWLAYKEDNPNYNALNFINARLEISGINKETPFNTVRKRVYDKLKQTKPTDGTTLPAYVSIVEFGTPKAYFKKK
jgi:hypothetical protein